MIDLLSGPPVANVAPATTSSKRSAPEPADDDLMIVPSTSWKKPKKKTHSLVKFTTEGCDALLLPSPSHDHQVL